MDAPQNYPPAQGHIVDAVEQNSQSNQDLLGGPYAVIESDPGV